jgi:hypothetical protein
MAGRQALTRSRGCPVPSIVGDGWAGDPKKSFVLRRCGTVPHRSSKSGSTRRRRCVDVSNRRKAAAARGEKESHTGGDGGAPVLSLHAVTSRGFAFFLNQKAGRQARVLLVASRSMSPISFL